MVRIKSHYFKYLIFVVVNLLLASCNSGSSQSSNNQNTLTNYTSNIPTGGTLNGQSNFKLSLNDNRAHVFIGTTDVSKPTIINFSVVNTVKTETMTPTISPKNCYFDKTESSNCLIHIDANITGSFEIIPSENNIQLTAIKFDVEAPKKITLPTGTYRALGFVGYNDDCKEKYVKYFIATYNVYESQLCISNMRINGTPIIPEPACFNHTSINTPSGLGLGVDENLELVNVSWDNNVLSYHSLSNKCSHATIATTITKQNTLP
jgi:hypothetical protein